MSGVDCYDYFNFLFQLSNGTPSVPDIVQAESKDIENFMKLFDELEFSEQTGLRVEFWGGEPLVYWKTLKPLAEELRNKYPNAIFGLITNGSLLDTEKNDWLEKLNIQFDENKVNELIYVKDLIAAISQQLTESTSTVE